jgi:hypothetical protein
MRALRNNKGWLRIIEIVLAATLVFSFMMCISRFEGGSQISRPDTDDYLLRQIGEDALRAYDITDTVGDAKSDLATDVIEGDWTSIGSYFDGSLEQNIGYAVYFYNDTSGYSDGEVYLETGTTNIPVNRDIATVYYMIAGDSGSHCSDINACAVKLDLWYMK